MTVIDTIRDEFAAGAERSASGQARVAVESVLAFGLLIRHAIHVLGYIHHAGEQPPSTTLRWCRGLMVNGGEQLTPTQRTTVGSVSLFTGAMVLTAPVGWDQPAAFAIVIANIGVLVTDPIVARL